MHLALGLLVAAAPAVFVGPHQAETRLGKAQVLDARGDDAEAPFLPGAIPIDWEDFRDGFGRTGRLADLDALAERLGALGLRMDRPVIVYGAMGRGWGEEARIWWMLRYLGHEDVSIVDGGIDGWVKANLPIAGEPSKPKPRKLTLKPRANLRADHRQVLAATESSDAVILDVRSLEEYTGRTPYFSKRGGHVPRARHINWRALIGKDGRLRPITHIKKRMGLVGATEDKEIITYCTAGVRSAFVAAALMQAGFTKVRNYDGSWWDWSARSELPISK